MEKYYDFKLEPGKKLNKIEFDNYQVLISVIIPFYNDEKYIEQSVNCILNQTFPHFELLIIDDGSKDEKSLKKLEIVSKLDERIKVFHKENEGLAATRDYGANKASKSSKYFMFLDSDDLIEKTFLECAYWSLETNKEATWVYSDSCGFDAYNYLWNCWFDSDKLKKVNDLESSNFIRKDHFYEVNGYELREKSVNEDWNFWLKQISKMHFPVHMSFYAKGYRRKNTGELLKAKQNRKRSLEIINKTVKTVKARVEAIQYPRNNKVFKLSKIDYLKYKSNKAAKQNILIFLDNLNDDKKDKLKEIIKLSKLNNIVVVLTKPDKNILRQEFEKKVIVYDLSSFLDRNYWVTFIDYLINKESINKIMVYDEVAYNLIPYLKENYNDININKEYLENEKINSEEIINNYLKNSSDNYNEIIMRYFKDIYGESYVDIDGNNKYNYRKQLLKEKLWNNSLWRKFVNSKLWKFLKKVIKK